jgi:large subunit ribosomal protein L18
MKISKAQKRTRIHYRVRKKISGTESRPRLCVSRSNKAIYCQIIDDVTARTLAAANSNEIKAEGLNKVAQSMEVGKLIADKAKSANITTVVFDRGGYLYHGRVKALADGAREGGLNF